MTTPAGKEGLGYPLIFCDNMFQYKNRMVWIPALLCLGIVCGLSISPVSASPQLPCEFYGQVSMNGEPAPAGTTITAYVNSQEQGKIVVKEPGKFGSPGTFEERLIVQADEDDFASGAPVITFRIGEKVADQTAVYEPGQSTQLSISIGGGAAAAALAVASAEPVQAPSTAVAPVVTPSATEGTAASVPVSAASAPVIPVVTPAPVNQSAGAYVVAANATPQPVVAAPVTPAAGTVSNQTNSTAGTQNGTPVVSFPSGQTVTA